MLPIKTSHQKITGEFGVFEHEPPILLASLCNKSFAGPNSDVLVCLTSLCIGHMNLHMVTVPSVREGGTPQCQSRDVGAVTVRLPLFASNRKPCIKQTLKTRCFKSYIGRADTGMVCQGSVSTSLWFLVLGPSLSVDFPPTCVA